MIKRICTILLSAFCALSSVVGSGAGFLSSSTFFVYADDMKQEFVVPITYSVAMADTPFSDNGGLKRHFNANGIVTIEQDNQYLTIGVEDWSLYNAFVPSNTILTADMEQFFPEQLLTYAGMLADDENINDILPSYDKCDKWSSDETLNSSFFWDATLNKNNKFGDIVIESYNENLDTAYIRFPISDYNKQISILCYFDTPLSTSYVQYSNIILDTEGMMPLAELESKYNSDSAFAYPENPTSYSTWALNRTNFAGDNNITSMIDRTLTIHDSDVAKVKYYFSSSFNQRPESIRLPINKQIKYNGSDYDWYKSPLNSSVEFESLPVLTDENGDYFCIEYDLTNRYDYAFGKEIYFQYVNPKGKTRCASIVPFFSNEQVHPLSFVYTENDRTVISIDTDTTHISANAKLHITKNKDDIINKYFTSSFINPESVTAYTIEFEDENGNEITHYGKFKLSISLPDDFNLSNYAALKENVDGTAAYQEEVSIGEFDIDNHIFTNYMASAGETYGYFQPFERTNITNLDDGVYEVGVDFLRYNDKTQPSMSNAAVNHNAYIVVKTINSITTRQLFIKFHDMSYEGQNNLYIGDVFCDDGYCVTSDDNALNYRNNIVYKDLTKYTEFAIDETGSLINNADYNAITEYACVKGAIITIPDESYNKKKTSYNIAVASPVMSRISNQKYENIRTDELCVDMVFTNVKPSDKSEAEVKAMFAYDVSALTRQVELAKIKLNSKKSFSSASIAKVQTAYDAVLEAFGGTYDPLNNAGIYADKLEELGTNLENAIKALDSITVAGYNAQLDKDITFDFYLSMNKTNLEAAGDGDLTATITKADGSATTVEVGADGKIEFNVAPKEIGQALKVKIGSYEFTYSVQEYLEKLIWYAENPTEGVNVSEKDAAIAKSLLVYGGYAQDYFVKKDAETNAYVDTERAYANVDNTLPESAENASAFEAPQLGENIKYYGAAVAFDYATDIRLYFTVKDEIENHSFAVNDAAVTPVAVDGGYYIAIENIYANQLGNPFKITVDGTDFQYGVYNYIAAALNATEVKSGALNELQALVKALYQYAELTKSEA